MGTMQKFALCLVLFVICASAFNYDERHHHNEKQHHSQRKHALNRHQNKPRNRHQPADNSTSATSPPSAEPPAGNSTSSNSNSTSTNSTSPVNLTVSFNANLTLIAFYNSSGQVAAIFNFSSNLVVLINSQSAVLLDAANRSLSEINDLSLGQQDFQSLFANISSLEELAQNASPVENPAQNQLIVEVSVQLGAQSSNPLLTLVVVSKSLQQYHNHSLKGLLVSTGQLNVRVGLLRFVVVLGGLDELLSWIPGGAETITKSGSRIDLEGVVNAPNGIQALIRVLVSIKGNLELGKHLSNGLGSLEIILKIVIQLGGDDSSNGVNRVVKFAYTVLEVIKDRADIQVLFRLLVEFATNQANIDGNDIRATLDDLLDVVRTQVPGFLQPLIIFLKQVIDKNLILDKVDCGRALIALLSGNVQGALHLVLSVITHLTSIGNPVTTVPKFFGFVLGVIASGNSSLNISKLIPGLNVPQLQDVLKNLNLSQVLQNGTLNQIPGIAGVIGTFTGTLQKVSNGSLNFQEIIKAEASIAAIIAGAGNSTQISNLLGILSKTPFGSIISGIIGNLTHVPGIGNILNNTIGTNGTGIGNILNSTVIGTITNNTGIDGILNNTIIGPIIPPNITLPWLGPIILPHLPLIPIRNCTTTSSPGNSSTTSTPSSDGNSDSNSTTTSTEVTAEYSSEASVNSTTPINRSKYHGKLHHHTDAKYLHQHAKHLKHHQEKKHHGHE